MSSMPEGTTTDPFDTGAPVQDRHEAFEVAAPLDPSRSRKAHAHHPLSPDGSP
jgi:hypothetical protein